jgi:predicted Zn-dependent protease
MFFSAGRLMCCIFATSLVLHAQQAKVSVFSIESLIRSGKYDQALQLTTAGLHNTPRDFHLWTLKGIVYSIRGNNKDALVSFEKALHLSPGYPSALKGEARLLYQSEDKRAIPALKEILKADPKDATAHEMLAMLLRKQGDCWAAMDHFQQSMDAVSVQPDALEAYGDCMVRMKRMQDAVLVFEKLSALVPQSMYPKYDLAVVLIGTQQNEATLKILEPMLAADASDPDLLSLAPEAYEAVGDTPTAVSLLRQAIVLNPREMWSEGSLRIRWHIYFSQSGNRAIDGHPHQRFRCAERKKRRRNGRRVHQVWFE